MGLVFDMYEMSNRYVLLKLEFQDKVKIAIIPSCKHRHNGYLRSKLLLLATNNYRLHFPKYSHYTNALCTELRYDIDQKLFINKIKKNARENFIITFFATLFLFVIVANATTPIMWNVVGVLRTVLAVWCIITSSTKF